MLKIKKKVWYMRTTCIASVRSFIVNIVYKCIEKIHMSNVVTQSLKILNEKTGKGKKRTQQMQMKKIQR